MACLVTVTCVPQKLTGAFNGRDGVLSRMLLKGLLWALRLELLELLIIIGLMSLMPRSRTELKNILFDHDPTGVLGAQVCLRPLLFQSRPPAPGMK